MKKLIILILIISLIAFSSCTTTLPSTKRKNYYFDDLNSSVDNERECYRLCVMRETHELYYRCDYDPVICDNGECVCKTW